MTELEVEPQTETPRPSKAVAEAMAMRGLDHDLGRDRSPALLRDWQAARQYLNTPMLGDLL
jgi:hypothetical protein